MENSNLSHAQEIDANEYDGIQVRLCSDGKYHWTFPMDMLRNPSAYFTICKIFGALGGIAFITAYIGPVFRGDFAPLVHDLKYWGIAVLAFLLISAVAYLIVAAIYRGKYIVRFTMDEKGILHEQIPQQKKKAQVMGGVVGAAGVLGGKAAQAGQGALIAAHTSLSSDFSKVRSIKAFPRRSFIKVNEPLSKNEVYVCPEDFDFVLNYIKSRCPGAK